MDVAKLWQWMWGVTFSSTEELLWQNWTSDAVYNPPQSSPFSAAWWMTMCLWNISVVVSGIRIHLFFNIKCIAWHRSIFQIFVSSINMETLLFISTCTMNYLMTNTMNLELILCSPWISDMLSKHSDTKNVKYSVSVIFSTQSWWSWDDSKLTLIFPWKSIFTGANAVEFNLSTKNIFGFINSIFFITSKFYAVLKSEITSIKIFNKLFKNKQLYAYLFQLVATVLILWLC